MYRTIDCDTWDDPWFADLSPRAKLLFIYFVTNRRTTPAGCFEITLRAIEFETGVARESIEAALAELEGRVTWWPDLQVIFVRNFYRHQRANSNRDNFRKSAATALEDFPEIVRSTVGDVYPDLADPSVSHGEPIHIPSPTHGYKETEQIQNREETEGESADAPAPIKALPRNGRAQQIVATWYETAGGMPVNYQKAVGLGQTLANHGATDDDIRALYRWLSDDSFFGNKFDLGTGVSQWEKFQQSRKQRQPKPAPIP